MLCCLTRISNILLCLCELLTEYVEEFLRILPLILTNVVACIANDCACAVYVRLQRGHICKHIRIEEGIACRLYKLLCDEVVLAENASYDKSRDEGGGT